MTKKSLPEGNSRSLRGEIGSCLEELRDEYGFRVVVRDGRVLCDISKLSPDNQRKARQDIDSILDCSGSKGLRGVLEIIEQSQPPSTETVPETIDATAANLHQEICSTLSAGADSFTIFLEAPQTTSAPLY